jgi:YcxB-like protein
MTTTPKPAPVDNRVTLEDHLAFHMHLLRQKENRAVRRRREIRFVGIGCLAGVFGVAIGWVLDPDPLTVREFIAGLTWEDKTYFVRMAAAIGALIAGYLMMLRLTERWRVRGILRRVLKARPDVQPADPTLAYEAVAVFGPEGIRSNTDVTSITTRWTAMTAVHESDNHLFFLTGPFSGVFVPKRSLPPEQEERLRSLMKDHLPKIAVTSGRT